jgi:hypothetical protein
MFYNYSFFQTVLVLCKCTMSKLWLELAYSRPIKLCSKKIMYGHILVYNYMYIIVVTLIYILQICMLPFSKVHVICMAILLGQEGEGLLRFNRFHYLLLLNKQGCLFVIFSSFFQYYLGTLFL